MWKIKNVSILVGIVLIMIISLILLNLIKPKLNFNQKESYSAQAAIPYIEGLYDEEMPIQQLEETIGVNLAEHLPQELKSFDIMCIATRTKNGELFNINFYANEEKKNPQIKGFFCTMNSKSWSPQSMSTIDYSYPEENLIESTVYGIKAVVGYCPPMEFENPATGYYSREDAVFG